MSRLDHASLIVSAAMIAVILTGTVRNRLWRLCRSFTVYLGAVGVGSTLIALWPGTFYNWGFWQAKELTYAALKLAVALEIGALSFQAFPGARARARQFSIVILLATLAALALTPSGTLTGPSSVVDVYLELQPRVIHGTVMLFSAVWGLILWYVIPLHSWHRAILRGLLPYMLVFTVGVRLLSTWRDRHQQAVGYADSIAYLAVLSYWIWEAWRLRPKRDHPEILSRLQPWLDQR